MDELLATMAPPLNLGFALKDLGDFNKKLTDKEKKAHNIPLGLNDDPPGLTVMSATWNLLEGKNRDGVPYLPENPASDSRRRSICLRRTSRRWRSVASITRRASTNRSIPTQAMLSIPSHIKCFRETVGSREHLMKLSFHDFAAGAHICYTDAVFTADCYALYLSRKFDRELRA